MSSNTALGILLALGLPLFGCSCGASQPNEFVDAGASDSGAEAASDASPKPDVATSDVIYDPDSSAPAPWYFAEAKGWERVRGVGDCYVYEANDASKLDPLEWEPCKDVACTRLKTPWAAKSAMPKVRIPTADGIAIDAHSYIALDRPYARWYESIVYDLTDNAIVRAIGNDTTQRQACSSYMSTGVRGTFANSGGAVASTRLRKWRSKEPETRRVFDSAVAGIEWGRFVPGERVDFLTGAPGTTRVIDPEVGLLGTKGPPAGAVVASPSGGAYLINNTGSFGIEYLAADATFETIWRPAKGRALAELLVDRTTSEFLWTDVESPDPLFFDTVNDFTLYAAPLPTTAAKLTSTTKKVATLTNDWNTWIGKVPLLPFSAVNAGLVLYLASPKEAIVLRRSDGKRWSFKAPTSPDPLNDEGFSRAVWVDEHEAVLGIGRMTNNLTDLVTLVRYPHPK